MLMTVRGRPSYVIGNSWQLNSLSDDEKAALDQEPFVFVCNLFPQHWKHLGFRPTVWAMGDTYNPPGCEILSRQLDAIREDEVLRARLRHMFVCIESPAAKDIVAKSTLRVTLYSRGDWTRREQKLATSLDETIYHFGSTLTDVVNLALILNPGNEVRLIGCQYGNRSGHFYNSQTGTTSNHHNFPVVVNRMWQGFSDMARAGVELFDCNGEHSPEMPEEYRLPRKLLFP